LESKGWKSSFLPERVLNILIGCIVLII